MPGILGDLIGDLTWSPKPIKIKVFSSDVAVLKEKAGKIAELIDSKGGGSVDGSPCGSALSATSTCSEPPSASTAVAMPRAMASKSNPPHSDGTMSSLALACRTTKPTSRSR